MRSPRIVVTLVLVLMLSAVSLSAQTSLSTSAVTGTVYDKTGAVVPKASIELLDMATGARRSTTSANLGEYFFTAIQPGNYRITVSAQGFRRAIVNGVKVSVGKSTLMNVTLELGEVTQVVEVQAGVATELQTLNASVGNLLDQRMLDNLPSLRRDATEILLFQPMSSPGFNNFTLGGGEAECTGGQVAGARGDQNTFLVDGGDATDSTNGNGGYSGTSFHATPRAVVPTPVESLEEFRVVTNNPDTTFSRASGAEVQMVTRRGSNAFHGAVYDWLQNNHLNANTWTRNMLGEANPVLRDNRFGGRLGGPIIKDKTFFFVHYEGRRFFTPQDVTRLVPTESMKLGILKFVDASGNTVAYNLNPGTKTDPVTGQSIAPSGFDPRGLGLNPVISSLWALMPPANNFTTGDGLNTAGFTAPSPVLIREDFGVARFDQKISDKWQLMTSYRQAVTDQNATVQTDIGGLAPGDVKGQIAPTATRPLQPRYLVVGLTGQVTSHLTSDFRFNWLRHWWGWGTFHPSPQVSGTTQALSVGGDSISTSLIPINFDVQNARSRVWNGHDYTFQENLSLLKGTHMFQFGGRAETQRLFHQRDDKVLVATIYPFLSVGHLASGTNITINHDPTVGPLQGPQACGGAITTNCLSVSDLQNWDNFYGSVLGMVDRGAVLRTRGPDFSPNPPGTPILQHTIVDSYQLYFSDSWRIRPSVTFSYGLTWGIQLPPFEQTGEQTIMIDDSTGKPINQADYLNARLKAALQGQIFNPQFDLVPIRKAGLKYPYDPDWHNFAPRASLAWNPSITSGFLGKILGDRKTVIRAGYARVYDRLNGVGIVMTPALGAGFGNTLTCRGPRKDGTCGGATGNDANTAFRIGPDGSSVPLPDLQPIATGSPLIPGVNSPFEFIDFRIDPKRKTGYSDGWDLTIQRELPGSMLLELGYVGRYAKRLYQSLPLNNVPYMMVAGGQSFAEAYHNVHNALLANPNASVPMQSWFETMLGGTGSSFCTGFSTCTAATVATAGPAAFINGNVFDIWTAIDSNFPNFPNGGGANTNQIDSIEWTASTGYSNYNAGFVSLRKHTSHGLVFDFNYTYSHSLDQYGVNQDGSCENIDAFDLNRDYGPSLWDRRHIVNALVTYDLPFGPGRKFATGGWLSKIAGGWNVSGIYVFATGIPLTVTNFSNSFGEEFGADDSFSHGSGEIPIKPGIITSTPHQGVIGSGNIATSGSSQLNAFADPVAVFNNFRVPDPFVDGRAGWGFVRSFNRWNVDFALGKETKITERITTRFDVHMTNVFNHPLFASTVAPTFTTDVSVDKGVPGSFGVLGQQYNQPRFIQFGLHIGF